MNTSETITTDLRQRFVFDDLDLRGCIVSLQQTCEEIQATHHYPKNLGDLLNQFALAAALLRDSIKFDGSLTIQLRTQGPIALIMADCMADRRVRAIAEYDQEQFAASDTLELNQLGAGTILAITISPDEGERYQSIVPIDYASLADCLGDYFARSEQLPSSFKLISDQNRAVGIALHSLPAEKVQDKAESDEHFNRLNLLLDSLTQEEALGLDHVEVLTRLFHDESCRLFDAHSVEFGCDCSAEKSLDAIQSLGESDVESLIAEQAVKGESSLIVDCHFCFQRYEIEFNDARELFN